MKTDAFAPRLLIWFRACRPRFLTASAAPVLAGSALGYAYAGSFDPYLFVLAVLAIIFLHAGANIANDFFDHLSGNDASNLTPTPFSGGRRFIQQAILSPKATLILSIANLAIGASLGIAIVYKTSSIFILILGLLGLFGGFFYTAPPFKLGYRTLGESAIAVLFGILPVYGSFYIQTQTHSCQPLIPGAIAGLLIFLVILINEFPDRPADAAVNKKTLPVRFGVPAAVRIYRSCLVLSYLFAVIAIVFVPTMRLAALFFLLTLPLAFKLFSLANTANLTTPTDYTINKLTILLHLAGCVAMAGGFMVTALSV